VRLADWVGAGLAPCCGALTCLPPCSRFARFLRPVDNGADVASRFEMSMAAWRSQAAAAAMGMDAPFWNMVMAEAVIAASEFVAPRVAGAVVAGAAGVSVLVYDSREVVRK
jgi:hypothetical protein